MTSTETVDTPGAARPGAWRPYRRPTPWLGHAVAAGGGTVVAAGVVALGLDSVGTGRAVGPALLVAGMTALAYALWRPLPSLLRAALTAVVVVGIGATFGFLFLPGAETFGDVRGFVALSLTAWLLAYLVGSARGRVVLLTLALSMSWFWATSEIARPSTPAGVFAQLVPFGFPLYFLPLAGFGCTTGFESQSGMGFADSAEMGVPTEGTQIDYPVMEDHCIRPRFGAVGIVSLAIGSLFFLALFVLDSSSRRGTATAFAVPGTIAIVVGLIEIGIKIGADWNASWLTGVVSFVVGLGVGCTGVGARRRFTTWFGAFTATVGVVIFSADISNRAFDLDGSDPGRKVGALLVAFGLVAVAVAYVVGRIVGEPSAGDDAAEPTASVPA
jgi:hypothetical protein